MNTRIQDYSSVREWKTRTQIALYHIGARKTRRIYKYSTFAQEEASVRKCAREDNYGSLNMILPLFTKLNLN